jgi:DnaK suppressor protein
MMTNTQFHRFKTLLEDKKAILVRELRQRRDHLAIEDSGDLLDRASNLAWRELAICSVDLEWRLLRRVGAALREIEEGTFGRCASCDRGIPLKRLEAVPWSLYCISCQEAAEAEEQELEKHGLEWSYALAS